MTVKAAGKISYFSFEKSTNEVNHSSNWQTGNGYMAVNL